MILLYIVVVGARNGEQIVKDMPVSKDLKESDFNEFFQNWASMD